MKRKIYRTMMNFCFRMAMKGKKSFGKWCRAYIDFAEKWAKAV